MSSIEVVSHKAEVLHATERKMKAAAMMIGGTVEGHAKELCPVDTGLLRNSITYAIGGSQPNTTSYQSNHVDKNRHRIEVEHGFYAGEAPRDADDEVTVYVGTNVQYAPYIELGHSQEVGRYVPALKAKLKKGRVEAKPFLRPAMENFRDEIKQIIEMCLK